MTGPHHLLSVRGKEIRLRTGRIVVASKWSAVIAVAWAITTAVGHVGLAIYDPFDDAGFSTGRLMMGYLCLLALAAVLAVLNQLVKTFFEVNEVEHDD